MKEKTTKTLSSIGGRIGELWKKHFPYTELTVRRLVTLTTVLYGWLLVWALWLKFNDNWSITLNYSWLSEMTLWERFTYDLIPFQLHFDHTMEILNILANCIVFAPLGVLLNILFEKKSILRDIAICFGASLFFELLQLFTVIGNFATTDLITNVAGYFIGLGVYHLIFKRVSAKFNVIFFSAVNLALIAVTAFSVVRTVLNFEPVLDILLRRI